ncbi:MAG: sigma-54-dependent transcriptional regulator, partial [Methylophilaceae bacterium]
MPDTNKKPSCLIVDDETDLSELLVITLERMGIHAESADTLDDAKFMLRQRQYDLCLTDMRLPDGNGLDLVRHISQHHAGLPVAVITAFGSADNAVSALKAGAFDYLTKPISLQQLRPLVQSALKLSQPQSPLNTSSPVSMIGESPAITQIRTSIEKCARSQAPVYISGEAGSGKELAARLIYQNSARVDGPFVIASCSSIAENLMESEFFGHKKGAFPGASQDKQGLFQKANGGILFLDDVSDLPLNMQVKLLRTIQEKKIRVLGATEDEAVDVRIISATHRDLGKMMEKGTFRQDLYYRLNVISLKMPALREIAQDIPLICEYLIKKQSDQLGVTAPKLNNEAINQLTEHRFTGNIRELECIIERALSMCDGNTITTHDLSLPADSPAPADTSAAIALDANGLPLPEFLENIEKQAILVALEKTRQNKTAAAKL